MKTIIVHMSDEQWTMEAMHLASALARNVNGRIVLLHLVLANNPGLLGWEIAAPDLTKNQLMKAYATVAEDYGVEFCVQPMQFINFVDALAEATSLFDASVLFCTHSPEQDASVATISTLEFEASVKKLPPVYTGRGTTTQFRRADSIHSK